jgi:hypothetical protein
VLVTKCADHLPLYRHAQIYARQGIQLDHSTLADWVGRAAWDGAYAALARLHQQIRLALCLAHVRRKFYELAEGSPRAAGGRRRIASLYAIEEEMPTPLHASTSSCHTLTWAEDRAYL